MYTQNFDQNQEFEYLLRVQGLIARPLNGGWVGDWWPFHIRETWTVWERNRKKRWFKLFTRKSFENQVANTLHG